MAEGLPGPLTEGSLYQPGPGVVTEMAAGSRMGKPAAAVEKCASRNHCHKSDFLLSHCCDQHWPELAMAGLVAAFGYH